MSKIYYAIIGFLLISNLSVAQTYTWIGGASGDYQTGSNWSPAKPATPAATAILAFDVTSPIAVYNVSLNQTIGAIRITAGTNSVSFATSIPGNVLRLNAVIPLIYNTPGTILSADFLTIRLASTAAFSMSSGTFGISPSTGGKIIINSALTLSGGTLDFDVPGTGGVSITGSIINNSGTFNCDNPTTIAWVAGSTYNHNVNGATPSAIPVSTWAGGSTCIITGMSSPGAIAPTGLGLSNFGNFSWDCPGQVSPVNLNLAGTTMNITTAFRILNTNNQALVLAGTGGGTVNAGSYTQNVATTKLILQSAGDITTLSVSGNFSNTLGVIDAVAGTLGGSGILDLKGAVTKTGTWQSTSTSPAARMTIQFSGSVSQNVSLGGPWADPVAGTSNIVVTNSSGVNLLAASILKVISSGASTALCSIGGPVTTSATGTISYTGTGTGGFTLLYNSTVAQPATAIEFPSVNGPTNLTINNIAGVSFPVAFNRTIPGKLTLLSGNLALGTVLSGDTLSLTNPVLANQIAFTSGFITTGTLSRYFPTSGLPTAAGAPSRFPFGTGITDRSLNVYFSGANLTGGTPGMISVTHSPAPNTSPISVVDNGVTLDKRTNTSWGITTSGGFNLGSGGERIAVTALGTNIGSVTSVASIASLRLTDGTTGYGTLIATTGTDTVPLVGKRDLLVSDITNKTLYFGSDINNSLVIITFIWNGSVSTNWATAANWTTNGAGYPSSPTEIAIVNTIGGNMPNITGIPISVYKLTVGSSASLTMTGNASMKVADSVTFNGTASFSTTSIFTYSSQSTPQNIAPLVYGNLVLSGLGPKILPAGTVTVTGVTSANGPYLVSGLPPTELTAGTNTFVYAGTGAQRVAATFYNNLSIINSRGGAQIWLGPGGSANTIKIAGNFVVDATNYVGRGDFNTVDFISTGTQPIPGFIYGSIRNTGNGPRILDPLGTTDVLKVISVNSYIASSLVGGTTVTGSKVKFVRSGNTDMVGSLTDVYNDLEISGSLGGNRLDFSNSWYIRGNFTITATNFIQTNNTYSGSSNFTFYFEGNGDQVIPATYPAFSFHDINITGSATRKIILQADATKAVGITGAITVVPAFASPNGFVTTGSTVNFSKNSNTIPALQPATGSNNYNNVSVSGGTRILEKDMTIGGNLSVVGTDSTLATLTVGNGSGPAMTPRILTVLGNILISGTSALSQITGQIDLNSTPAHLTTIILRDSLSITGFGQLAGAAGPGSSNGIILFNGSLPKIQAYKNNSFFKNGAVNFQVGNGTTITYLSLTTPIDLLSSSTAIHQSTISVANNAFLNCDVNNIISNGTGNAVFNLDAGATLITANTGGIEGTATSSSTGSILNNASIVRTYSPTASYVFNASTATPFAPAITPMANLTIGNNAAVTLNKSVEVSKTLIFKNSIVFALSAFDLTLKSTATGTARVDSVPLNATITYGTGRFVVERFYPMSRSWRLVTSPLSNTGSIFNSWQDGAPGTYVPGKGMFVTGPNPTGAGGNGLDYSVYNNYSMKTYNSATNSYVNIGDTKSQNLSGNTLSGASIGYYAFVRGDRNRTPDNTVAGNMNNTTLSSRGFLQTGTQTFNFSSLPATFPLVGNPYASSVDFNKISKVGINPKRFYVYDPSLGTLGVFVTMEESPANSGIYLPSAPATSVQRNYIQSSQAFFVETDGSNNPATSVVFNEGNKSTDYNPVLFRPATPLSQPASFRTNLFHVNADNDILLVDGNLVQFDASFNDVVDMQDALKFPNINENLGFLRLNKLLAVERRKPITATDTLFFKLTKTTQRSYQFQFEPTNLDPTITAFLEDSYTAERIPVSVTSSSEFNFTINGDPKSAAAARFRIVFSASNAGPLPVNYKSIKAYQQGADIAVEWTVENEISISKYEVEKSADGINFNKVNTIGAKGAGSGSINYHFLDINAVPGDNFYRILSLSKTGAVEYSRVVVVKLGKTSTGISIYPNPVTGNMIGVAFNNMAKGNYQVRLINSLGQTLMTRQLSHSAGSSMETLTPGSRLSTGIYQLEVTAPDKRVSTFKVIAQ